MSQERGTSRVSVRAVNSCGVAILTLHHTFTFPAAWPNHCCGYPSLSETIHKHTVRSYLLPLLFFSPPLWTKHDRQTDDSVSSWQRAEATVNINNTEYQSDVQIGICSILIGFHRECFGQNWLLSQNNRKSGEASRASTNQTRRRDHSK